MKLSIFRNDEGSVAVEFALVSMAFISLFVGIFETGRMFLYWNSFQYAVEDSLRHLMVSYNNEQTLSNDDLEEYISEKMSAFKVSSDDVSMTISEPYDLSGVSFVDVEGTLDFVAIIPFLPLDIRTFSLDAEARLPVLSGSGG
jgi:hypothetical protein